MKLLLALTVLLSTAASTSFARSTMITGRAQEFGNCSFTQGRYCIDRIAERAERSAERDGEWRCKSEGGNSRALPFCSSTCNPSFLTPRDQNTPVRCNATCNVTCEIKT